MAQNNAKLTATTEHVPAGEHGRSFPPFDPQHFASQLFWLTITFVALYLLMSRLALPRIETILEERGRRIADDLQAASRLKEQSDTAIAAHEKALNEARARAQALANTVRAQAAAQAQARRKEVDAGLNRHIAEAEKTIAATRAAAMGNVRGIAGEAAAAIVERLVGAAPSAQDVAEAVGAAVKQ
jgi:F-type H+-transporting ATPase subunit b